MWIGSSGLETTAEDYVRSKLGKGASRSAFQRVLPRAKQSQNTIRSFLASIFFRSSPGTFARSRKA